jgi:hypothetical protein
MSLHAATLPAPVWRAWFEVIAGVFGRRGNAAGDTLSVDAARELAAVRALADRYRRSDPGFASDLYAAAARYESSLADKA